MTGAQGEIANDPPGVDIIGLVFGGAAIGCERLFGIERVGQAALIAGGAGREFALVFGALGGRRLSLLE